MPIYPPNPRRLTNRHIAPPQDGAVDVGVVLDGDDMLTLRIPVSDLRFLSAFCNEFGRRPSAPANDQPASDAAGGAAEHLRAIVKVVEDIGLAAPAVTEAEIFVAYGDRSVRTHVCFATRGA